MVTGLTHDQKSTSYTYKNDLFTYIYIYIKSNVSFFGGHSIFPIHLKSERTSCYLYDYNTQTYCEPQTCLT